MSELVKGLEKFMTRDLTHIIGGSVFLYSIIKILGLGSEILQFGAEGVFLFLALAYVIGYTNQELVSLTRIVTTGAPTDINNPILRNLYERWTGLRLKYKDEELRLDRSQYLSIKERLQDQKKKELDRIIVLKQIGSSIGANFLLCGVVLILDFFVDIKANYSGFFLAVLVFVYGLGMVIICWLKTIQQYVLLKDEESNQSACEH